MQNSLKIGFWGLTGLVISAMIGSGVFALPQNMAVGAGVGAICIAWLITAVGMFFLANTLRVLSIVRPEAAVSGIYIYAKEGFGNTAGFFTAWGYWVSNVFAISAFATVLTESLNYFFPPYFKGGNTIYALLTASLVIWGFYFLILRGIKKTAAINLVGTCCKLVPLFFFMAAVFVAFNFDTLKTAFVNSFSSMAVGGVPLMAQIRNTMIITLWTFIGIEAAIVLSSKVREQKQIARAILSAFLLCIIMYIIVSVLPFGILTREQIAAMPNPSTAGILEHIIGPAGAVLMNVGMIVSVLFATLSMITITAEVPFAAAKEKSFPKIFTKENKNGVPGFSLLFTVCAVQLALFIGFFMENAFHTLLTITAVMVMPVYFITALYLVKLASPKRFPTGKGVAIKTAFFTGALGTAYAVWLVYAANLKYLLLAVIFFLLGAPFLIMSRRQKKVLD
ncbi:arginine:ornithine antiporter/lysine permease [Elusimicrobium simillimum]|uniref:basic amino acid/polyamine antiporter n=1 Tax=Elusimicrobium simillimum TaxID=3143438 RepID=UPI003C6F03B5